ncbi:MBL fold metallo-hydrolase [Ascidiimonas sp. W6]|uniref:MBL fold metallo-hydrolase n=1 Tax=Ascidiimonas meishanensis TaxID=3128903 RepID=UPI0030EB6BEF
MKKIKYFLFLLSGFIMAQETKNITDNDLEIIPINHATFIIKTTNTTIYVDPYGKMERFKNQPQADLILITDIHGDHLSLPTLESIDVAKATFIVPEAVNDKLPEKFKLVSKILHNGDSAFFKDIKIEAIPMYNLPDDSTSRHPKGRGNGYILTIKNKRIYISGDTEDIPEMRALQNINIAFICMNLPYTMDIYQAADAVLDFKPTIVYPYHYRGKPDMSDVSEFKALVNAKNKNIEVKLLEWYPN